MKFLLLLATLILIFPSCSQNTIVKSQLTSPKIFESNAALVTQDVPAFKDLLDSMDLVGSILIFDPQTNKYLGNNVKRWEKGYLPASTFKIPNSIIALETGIVKNQKALIEWDGQKRKLPIWEKDMLFREAYHLSCLPCYQKIARRIGAERMNIYLKKFQYGDMVVSDENIDVFWLEGKSKITQMQQIGFLKKLYYKELPISERTFKEMKKLMIIQHNEAYILSGKTGWSIRNGENIGWFVGYLESGDKIYFIATNIEPKEKFQMEQFPFVRRDVSMRAFRHLEIIE